MSTDQNEANSKPFDRLTDLALGWLPLLVLFIFVPFALYLPNQSEFDFDLTYVIPFVLLAALSLVIVIPLLMLRRHVRTKIVKFLFFIGLYLLIAEMIVPLRMGSLMSGPEWVYIPESGFREIVQLILLGGLFVLALGLPFERMRTVAAKFVIALTIVEIGYVTYFLSPNTGIPWIETKSEFAPRPERPAATGNIYQICFDELSSVDALAAIEESRRRSEFDGFTLFKNNRANYAYTAESMPSYFTGSFFEGGSLRNWMEQQFKSGLIENLRDAGYAISMYVPTNSYMHRSASDGMNKLDSLRESLESPLKFQYYDFADLWLVRLSPAWLGEEIYDEYGRGLFRKSIGDVVNKKLLGQNEDRESSKPPESWVPTIAKAMSTEDSRAAHGQYVYVHTYVTHEPWGRRKGNCERLAAAGNKALERVSRADFTHASCAVELMAQIVAKLKQLGRYRESTIIFHSDHGSNIEPTSDDCLLPQEIRDRISGVDYQWWCRRTFGFLLVKPAGESGLPLRVSESPTQLADIPATICGILDLPFATSAGRSVFSLKEDEEREIHMFGGLVRNWFRTKLFPGKQTFEGSMFHVSFSKGKGWRLYPNIPWKWN